MSSTCGGSGRRRGSSIGAIAEQFLHNVTAYATRDDLPPADALRLFLQLDRDKVVARLTTQPCAGG